LLPASINTPHAYQWRPSLSGDWLLWGRRPETNHYQIMLANLETGRVIRLDDVRGHAAYAEPGQVNGRYATWLSCPDNVCRAYRYDVDAQTRIEMPPIGGGRYAQFGPAVTPDGTVYFGVDLYCANVRLARWRKGFWLKRCSGSGRNPRPSSLPRSFSLLLFGRSGAGLRDGSENRARLG
jgi:hypothetical protein